MELQERIEIIVKLGHYMLGNDEDWLAIKERASRQNAWFVPEFVELSIYNIATHFLQKEKLTNWVNNYTHKGLQTSNRHKLVGLVMAGNIPLVGFHDFLSVFLSGNSMLIKPSSKDEILIKHLVKKLIEFDQSIEQLISFSDSLKGCDAYIATGSNNSSRYFEYYFAKYPNIIRRNRSSVAIIDGTETLAELDQLSNDIQLYFGLGCRNVTKLYLPKAYDFVPLLDALKKYDYFADFYKYKNNFDYQLAALIMSNKYYMNNGSVIMTENSSLFSPVSQVHYEYYDHAELLANQLKENNDIQCVIGHGFTSFGKAQEPSLSDYADGVDTLQFLYTL